MKVVEVCSGIGGLSLAAESAGNTIVAHVEREPFCCAVLHKHWPDVPILNDLYEVTGDEYERPDMLMGGIPCQPFSEAGHKLGVRDPRHLWPEMFRLILKNRPRWVVIENVRGFITNGGLDVVTADLEREGYAWTATLLPAYLSGSPQQRERVFIVAHTERFEHRWQTALACGYDALWEQYGEAQKRTQDSDSYDARGADIQRAKGAGESRIQRGVVRNFDGLSSGVFRHRFPAGFGQQQYDGEPPRSVERSSIDVTLANKRAKALGNAVVPQQAFPIFAAIAMIEAEEVESKHKE